MPCRQVSTYNGITGAGKTGGGGYATEAECLEACKEGACCEGTTCTVTPQCQCQGTGKTFKGVGTTCSPNPCDPCAGACNPYPTHPVSLTMAISGFTGPQASKFQINAVRQISRSSVYIGTATCWAYTFSLLDIGDQCPTPFGAQAIDGLLLSASFSEDEGRLLANYKDASNQCRRYDIRWALTGNYSAQSRLCASDLPFSGSVTSQGVSFNYVIDKNPLP